MNEVVGESTTRKQCVTEQVHHKFVQLEYETVETKKRVGWGIQQGLASRHGSNVGGSEPNII